MYLAPKRGLILFLLAGWIGYSSRCGGARVLFLFILSAIGGRHNPIQQLPLLIIIRENFQPAYLCSGSSCLIL
jgi:hypothetical protein